MTGEKSVSISYKDLLNLTGEWEGTGHAEYPTIKPINYREQLILSCNSKDPAIHYEQRSWIVSTDTKKEEPIFWESGFIIDLGNGSFELVSAQKSGRVEILRGKAELVNKKIKLDLVSIKIVNDEKMIRSGRVFTFSKTAIEYELKMSISSNHAYQKHLSAKLTKKR